VRDESARRPARRTATIHTCLSPALSEKRALPISIECGSDSDALEDSFQKKCYFWPHQDHLGTRPD
jgi:hypothetical protein